MTGKNLIPPPRIELAKDQTLLNQLEKCSSLGEVMGMVYAHPESFAVWARLAKEADLDGQDPVTVYAYARVAYHRSLDALRKAGWRGQGLLDWDSPSARWVLRSWYQLLRSVQILEEKTEILRLEKLIDEANPRARELLGREYPRIERLPTEAVIIRGAD